MRKISFFVIAAALILAGIGGWIASTTTHATDVKVEGTPVGSGVSTLPLVL
jgi:hypothetical protein